MAQFAGRVRGNPVPLKQKTGRGHADSPAPLSSALRRAPLGRNRRTAVIPIGDLGRKPHGRRHFEAEPLSDRTKLGNDFGRKHRLARDRHEVPAEKPKNSFARRERRNIAYAPSFQGRTVHAGPSFDSIVSLILTPHLRKNKLYVRTGLLGDRDGRGPALLRLGMAAAVFLNCGHRAILKIGGRS